MRLRVIPVFFSLALMLASGATPAQTGGQDAFGTAGLPAAKPPIYPKLFPNPTNNNGYEEWVQAADLIRNNAKVKEWDTQPDATLALKRRVLADPAVAQALLLVRMGLHKPVYSPRTNLDENSLFPELAPFRQLARLLCAEQYVQFANGRVDAAIDSLRVGLAFGYRVQTDTVLSGLVGVAIHSMVIKEFSRHLDQLSVYQCDDVRRLVEDFLGGESPAAHLLALEKGYTLKMLEARRSDSAGLAALLQTVGVEDTDRADPDSATVTAYLKNHPADVNALIDDAENRVNAMYDQTLLNMRLPPTQRKSLARDTTESPGAALFRAVSIDPQSILDKYTRDQSQLRLLGVHALIHRYRWDHNVLPNGLAELHAPGWIKDAFEGTVIVYQRDGDRYTLASQPPAKGSKAGQ